MLYAGMESSELRELKQSRQDNGVQIDLGLSPRELVQLLAKPAVDSHS